MKKNIFLFIFCFLWTLQIESKEKTLCLNMIVKNESKIIKRCLDSVKSFIDYWVIIDTGSTDGTQKLIKDCMKDIPGKLYEEEWVNFEHNRNEALTLAKDKSDYILFMDADEELVFSNDSIKPNLEKDFYYIETYSEDVKSNKIKLIKNGLDWKWQGILYETIQCDKANTFDTLKDTFISHKCDGYRSQNPNTPKFDIEILNKMLQKERDNSHLIFNLAKSYNNANQKPKALEWYLKCISLQKNRDEVFSSMLQATHLKRELNYPLNEVINDYNNAYAFQANSYFNAHTFQEDRKEPVYYLADIYNQIQDYKLAYKTIKELTDITKFNKEKLYKNWIEDFGILYQFSVCSYHLGKYRESLDACNTLLGKKNLFKHLREYTEDRLKTILKIFKYRQFLLRLLHNDRDISKVQDPKSKDDLNEFEHKKVLLTIMARNKGYVLPLFLKCIENLDYDKSFITIYINTNDNTDNTLEILKSWIKNNKHKYNKIILDHHECNLREDTNPHLWTNQKLNLLGAIRNKSLKKTFEYNCDFYFIVDSDNFIFPWTLKELIRKDKPIIAPMLLPFPDISNAWTNYWKEVDEIGYYRSHPEYYKIRRREMIGTFKVPLVHCTYLIKANVIDKLSYSDGTNAHEFVVFSRIARKNNIDQYFCNEKKFGFALAFPPLDKLTKEDEKRLYEEFLENR